MCADGGKRNRNKALIRCSYCQRSFARTEHLARHERSHRKEKPFKCNYCESTFARKDVIKRHHIRYHSDIPQVNVTVNPAQSTAVDMDTSTAEETCSPTQPENQPAQVAPPAAEDIYMEGYLGDPVAMNFMPQPSMNTTNQIESFLYSISFPLMSDDMLLGSQSFAQGLDEATNPALSATYSSPHSLTTQLNQQNWRGSCEISTAKRRELGKEVQAAFTQRNEPNNLKLPSCLTFERLFNGCFEVFLAYLPCIHVPTWRAESAHPILLIALASLSAYYDGDYDTSQALYRAGRAAVTNFLDSDAVTRMEEQPDWLIQSILILISYGTSVGNRKSLNEALSWASLLANTIRRRKIPEFNDSEADQDSLSMWKEWIEYETAVRTKCASYLILNNLSICYNVAPALLNDEMSGSPLPCRETDWTATTPEAWSEARKCVQLPETHFHEALNGLLSPSHLETIRISSFGAYIMLHAIVQRMWRLQPEIWMQDDIWGHFQTSSIALQKWQVSWEAEPECSVLTRNPHGAVPSNAAALLRLAHMRLYKDFSPVRSAMVSLDAEIIAQSMSGLSISIDRSNSSLNTAVHALQALRTRIKLGMASKAPGRVSPHSLQLHLVSLECCLFGSAWVKEASSRPEYELTSDEKECIRLAGEILTEVDIGQSNAQKPYSTQLIYAWALVFERCAVWGIQLILADALKRYAESESQ